MGYEGHLMLLPDVAERARLTEECMAKLAAARTPTSAARWCRAAAPARTP